MPPNGRLGILAIDLCTADVHVYVCEYCNCLMNVNEVEVRESLSDVRSNFAVYLQPCISQRKCPV